MDNDDLIQLVFLKLIDDIDFENRMPLAINTAHTQRRAARGGILAGRCSRLALAP